VVLIVAGIHGDEQEGYDVASRLIEYLRSHSDLYSRRRVALIPAANPDGIQASTRVNARGVDCNRNFPTRRWGRGKVQKVVHRTAAGAASRSLCKRSHCFAACQVHQLDERQHG
jgi:predicted deacylase